MAKSKSKKISSEEDRLSKWKQSAIDNCIARGLLEIRAEKQQEKIEHLQGIIQDLTIENRYLKVIEEELLELATELEQELDEIYAEEEEYDEEDDEDDEGEDFY